MTDIPLDERDKMIAKLREQLASFPGVDDLCDHGAESGCCSACSQRGSVKP